MSSEQNPPAKEEAEQEKYFDDDNAVDMAKSTEERGGAKKNDNDNDDDNKPSLAIVAEQEPPKQQQKSAVTAMDISNGQQQKRKFKELPQHQQPQHQRETPAKVRRRLSGSHRFPGGGSMRDPLNLNSIRPAVATIPTTATTAGESVEVAAAMAVVKEKERIGIVGAVGVNETTTKTVALAAAAAMGTPALAVSAEGQQQKQQHQQQSNKRKRTNKGGGGGTSGGLQQQFATPTGPPPRKAPHLSLSAGSSRKDFSKMPTVEGQQQQRQQQEKERPQKPPAKTTTMKATIGAEEAANRAEHKRKMSERYRYGNFNNYYQHLKGGMMEGGGGGGGGAALGAQQHHNPPVVDSSCSFLHLLQADPRTDLFCPDWFGDRAVLDVGCNAGRFACTLARRFGPRRVLGVDIDPHLVAAARKNIRHFVDKDAKLSGKFPASFGANFGPISAPSTSAAPKFPDNCWFVCENYVLASDDELANINEEFDIVFALSVTKWVHLNWGDAGMRRFFHRVFRQLRTGGRFVLETAPFKSYKKHCAKKGDNRPPAEVLRTFEQISFLPEQFTDFLLHMVGFSHHEELNTPQSKYLGISGRLQVFYKGKFMLTEDGKTPKRVAEGGGSSGAGQAAGTTTETSSSTTAAEAVSSPHPNIPQSQKMTTPPTPIEPAAKETQKTPTMTTTSEH